MRICLNRENNMNEFSFKKHKEKLLLMVLVLFWIFPVYGAYLSETDSTDEIIRKLKAVEYGQQWESAIFEIRQMNSIASSDALYELLVNMDNPGPNNAIAGRLVGAYIVKEMYAKRFNLQKVLSLQNGLYKNAIILAMKSVPLDEHLLRILKSFSIEADDCRHLKLITEVLKTDRNFQIVNEKAEIISNILKTFPLCENFPKNQEEFILFNSYEGWTIGGVEAMDSLENILEIRGIDISVLREMQNASSDNFAKNCINILMMLKGDKNSISNVKDIIKDTSNDLYMRYFALSAFEKFSSTKDIEFLKHLLNDTGKLNPSEALKEKWSKHMENLKNSLAPSDFSKLSPELKEYPVRDKAQEILLKYRD